MTVQPPPLHPTQTPAADGDQLSDVPRGALALAAIAVGLLVLAWLATYSLAFLPRGPVG